MVFFSGSESDPGFPQSSDPDKAQPDPDKAQPDPDKAQPDPKP